MTITRYPSEIIVEDSEGNGDIAKVGMVDGSCATVTIYRDTNAREWKEISAQVLAALLDMQLDGDDRE